MPPNWRRAICGTGISAAGWRRAWTSDWIQYKWADWWWKRRSPAINKWPPNGQGCKLHKTATRPSVNWVRKTVPNTVQTCRNENEILRVANTYTSKVDDIKGWNIEIENSRESEESALLLLLLLIVLCVAIFCCCFYWKKEVVLDQKSSFKKTTDKKGKKLKVSELYRPTFQLLIGTFQLESVLISATRLSVSRSLNLKISDFPISSDERVCARSEPSFVFYNFFSLFFLIALREMNRL